MFRWWSWVECPAQLVEEMSVGRPISRPHRLGAIDRLKCDGRCLRSLDSPYDAFCPGGLACHTTRTGPRDRRGCRIVVGRFERSRSVPLASASPPGHAIQLFENRASATLPGAVCEAAG